MNVTDIKKDIKNKSIQHYYIFTGEEITVMNIYIAKMAEVADVNICRADTLSSIISRMQNRSVLKKSTCYVIRDDKDFLSAENVWEQLENDTLQNDNIVIMLYTSLDKRSKLYKHSVDSIVEFNALTDENLKREIQKRIALSDKNCAILIDICEHSLGRILLEIDKIKSFPSNDSDDTIFIRLLKDGTIYQPAGDVIWDFVDAILLRKKKQAFELLDEALEFGNPILTLISVLYKDAKQLLQVQGCQSEDISKSTGLSGWDIKRAKGRIGRYSNRELINAMKIIREAEVGIKSGRIDDYMALDYILVNIL